MNERIRGLAEQAGLIHEYMSTGERNDALKKFEALAELIVRECVTVARGADGLDATHEAWYLIERHFGVEE